MPSGGLLELRRSVVIIEEGVEIDEGFSRLDIFASPRMKVEVKSNFAGGCYKCNELRETLHSCLSRFRWIFLNLKKIHHDAIKA